jgi:catechol 2,3-dioxygenase-like lactoylglutathione lyase family enzyme
MLSHLSLGVRDLEQAAAFYQKVLAPLGYVCLFAKDHAVGFGEPGRLDELALFAKSQESAAPGPGFHLAFTAPSRDSVDAFHVAAIAAGATDAGVPGLRPQYGATYYAAFVVDPDGHKLEAVFQ